MKLYVCTIADMDVPGPIRLHPCTKAISALDEAGHVYERVEVKGGRLRPWTMKGTRDEVEELSGQKLVPILVLDDGTVITGSGDVVKWAKANPPTA
jgi:glutathione S-transferase